MASASVPSLMRKTWTFAVLAALLFAGCAKPGDGNGATPPAAKAPDAPWWPLGAAWDITFTRGDAAPKTVRMVNFLNESDHFWLGVQNRQEALDHALHDTNPFLGRVHWGLLAPHEGGAHAIMYEFPLERGHAFTSGNPFFGRDWHLEVEADASPPGWHVTGRSDDGATIAYDYDPQTQWFRDLAVKGPSGGNDLTAHVDTRADGATGTYWFHRGRDYYEGPATSGTHDETFEVPDEEREVESLAVEVDATFGGPYRVDLLAPDGSVAHTETTTGGVVRKTVEVAAPAEGTWTLRFVGTGDIQGRLDVTGILEYTATL